MSGYMHLSLPRRASGRTGRGGPTVLVMARPRNDERWFPIASRVPESQLELVQAYAAAHGMNISEFIRYLLTQELGVPIETELERTRRLRAEQLPRLEAELAAATAADADAAAEPRPQMIA